MVGGLIMTHGDDAGLRVPPRVAPIQAVVCVVRDGDGVVDAAAALKADLIAKGIRARLDDKVSVSYGRRVTDWELKGVPVRVEVGPRDLAEGLATVARRDNGEKQTVPLAAVADTVVAALAAVPGRPAGRSDPTARQSNHDGGHRGRGDRGCRRWLRRVFRWSAVGEDGENQLAAQAMTVRCLQLPDGSVPGDPGAPEVEALVARSY